MAINKRGSMQQAYKLIIAEDLKVNHMYGLHILVTRSDRITYGCNKSKGCVEAKSQMLPTCG